MAIYIFIPSFFLGFMLINSAACTQPTDWSASLDAHYCRTGSRGRSLAYKAESAVYCRLATRTFRIKKGNRQFLFSRSTVHIFGSYFYFFLLPYTDKMASNTQLLNAERFLELLAGGVSRKFLRRMFENMLTCIRFLPVWAR